MEFSSEKEAKKALKLNGRELAGRRIRVDNANSSQSPGNRGRGGTPRGTPRGGGGRGGEGQGFVCSTSAICMCTYMICINKFQELIIQCTLGYLNTFVPKV